MNKSKLLGWSFLLLIGYCMAGAIIYFASLLLLQQGKLLDLPWVVSAQKSLYRGGMVDANSWLKPGCIQSDPDLIYKPALGTCKFNDIEFNTTLNFDNEGRYTGPKPAGTGIAVIGDSHAMGWGVNDLETFSAQLQKLSGRPIYNLGVASYGTARELIRLEKSGMLGKVDTVIIQYCNNDKSENLEFDTASKEELHRKVFGPYPAPVQGNKLAFIARGYWLTLAAPFRSLAEKIRRKSFRPHYDALIPVLEKHRTALAGKRVIVFYSNAYGQKYRNYPAGQDTQMHNVYFVDLDLDYRIYHKLDNHLSPEGHRKVAERLWNYLQAAPGNP